MASASVELDRAQDDIYRPDLFIRYARRVLEEMGGVGSSLDACAREIYDEWAACQHFALYDDVQPALQELHAAGLRIGLISNTHRCLASFQSHFELEQYVTAALSSSDHGYMKPHPSIFEAALKLVDADPSESVMVRRQSDPRHSRGSAGRDARRIDRAVRNARSGGVGRDFRDSNAG